MSIQNLPPYTAVSETNNVQVRAEKYSTPVGEDRQAFFEMWRQESKWNSQFNRDHVVQQI